jgi:hypothetical protein
MAQGTAILYKQWYNTAFITEGYVKEGLAYDE